MSIPRSIKIPFTLSFFVILLFEGLVSFFSRVFLLFFGFTDMPVKFVVLFRFQDEFIEAD